MISTNYIDISDIGQHPNADVLAPQLELMCVSKFGVAKVSWKGCNAKILLLFQQQLHAMDAS